MNADDDLKVAALRWLRGEFTTKTEAKQSLDVRVIIDDDTWYDFVKVLALFVKRIGYKGLVIFIDEAVNLYKISNSATRNSNYERLLAILNDTLQGKAEYIGVIVGGTPQMVEDRQRGLFSYEALRTRLAESRFVRDGVRDLTGPLVRLKVLTNEEIFVLLKHIRYVHAQHYEYEPRLSADSDILAFMQSLVGRLGADQFLTPREVVRDFIAVLNLLYQNSDLSLSGILASPDFQPSRQIYDPDTLSPETEIKDTTTDNRASPYTSFEV